MSKKQSLQTNFLFIWQFYSIKDYRDELTAIIPQYRYFPKPAKSYLIVKEEAQNVITNSRVNVTAKGKRHVGSTEYCDQYVKNLLKDWNNQFTFL